MRIQEIFKQVAKANANKIAVRGLNYAMTYSGLDEASDNLTEYYVTRYGRHPEPLPIALSSPRMVAEILAALKAGKIAAVAKLGENFSLETVLYSDGAWLGFTSGSTGSSKAIVHSHRGVIALAEAEKKAYHFKDDEVIGSYRGSAALHRALFDGLLNGLTVSFAGGKLDEWIVEDRITHLSLTATTFRHIMLSPLRFPSLRLLSVGGEMVDWDDFKLFKESDKFSDGCVFLCRYACSEAQTVSILRLTKESHVGDGRLPVGYPMPGVEIKLIGEEIAIHSPWLAIEYWQDEELTRKKFKVDEANNKRWYMTGDRGYFKDGILHHEGRI